MPVSFNSADYSKAVSRFFVVAAILLAVYMVVFVTNPKGCGGEGCGMKMTVKQIRIRLLSPIVIAAVAYFAEMVSDEFRTSGDTDSCGLLSKLFEQLTKSGFKYTDDINPGVCMSTQCPAKYYFQAGCVSERTGKNIGA
jgi:hypothetical protein